ncbi:azurin [Gallaecimonas kandeliae]|uniref:azurin n=1 Tax=Gallaecimonas kandeliae TaxID=3029055 RepID=UPI0026471E42|nr:azurin [Gallaecimonas kandeliae]WKE64197.1 azurin [Gallaecimonas kandeliae]
MKKAILGVLLALGSTAAWADDCAATIEANDAMQYNLKEMTVPASCKSFTVTLKHVGKLPKNTMGHDWVLSKTADYQALAMAGAQAGLDKNYLPEGDARVLAATPIIGGGEETSVTVDVNKLDKGGDYSFFCSFPGHFAVMNGKFILK